MTSDLVEVADEFVKNANAFDFVTRYRGLLEILPKVRDRSEHDADVVVRFVVQLLKVLTTQYIRDVDFVDTCNRK